jgi:hypothetical protein
MRREVAAGLLQKNQCRPDENLPEGLSGRTPHWVGKLGNKDGKPVLLNGKSYDLMKKYADVETPSETLREFDVVFLCKDELPKHESDKDDAHVIKWFESANNSTCMLAIIPKFGRCDRKERFGVDGVKKITLTPVNLIIDD